MGFVDDVVLVTSAVNQCELSTRVQTLADAQINWASKLSAIFNAQKLKWMVFQPSNTPIVRTIDFGDRTGLQPVTETKWLGVTLDSCLTFKRHKEDVISKGKRRAHFPSSLLNTKWGIPPRLFKILMTATVHAATDYAVAAWLPLLGPKFFSERMMTIDSICATKALGALKHSPYLFLKHDLDLKMPAVRLTAKIMNAVATIVEKPATHPLYAFYQQAKDTKPQAHKGPLHAFFQSNLAEYFHCFLDLQQPDPTVPLPATPNFNTLIIKDKEKAMKSIRDLQASDALIIVYSDGSRIPKKNTAAAAWCENNEHSFIHQLGKESEYGIFEAEFAGLILALRLAKHSFKITTQRVTLVLDNQSVIKDMSTKTKSSRALSHKIEALDVIKEIENIAPHIQIVLR